MDRQPESDLLRERYTAALLSGDDREAERVVLDALQRGLAAEAIYVQIFGPALVVVGEAWLQGELSVAREHHATSVTLERMAHIRDATRRRDEVAAEVVVAAVSGEMHFVATRMIADLFHFDGWAVVHLGPDTPTADLVELVRDRGSDLVALSLSHSDRLGTAQAAVAQLKALDHHPAVFVGGSGIGAADHPELTGADLVSLDPSEAVRAARELLGIRRNRPTLESQLDTLGRRVQELRKERGWSQQRLASAAGLDRTYLGTVEQGKQNITIGAALKLADALDTSLGELIEPR
ncbi:MAG: helix-turn-helix domain-containing protein [Chloroflexi bacterium]|nr:helix-turn-helix domain-containing protein [Chloroflexota bacterium]